MECNPIRQARRCARETILEAVAGLAGEAGVAVADLPAFKVDIPSDRVHGDLAVNAAMIWAKTLKKPPRAIAEAIACAFDLGAGPFAKIEVAGPGFINLFLGDAFYVEAVQDILADPANFGRTNYGDHQKINVEFVSANPTGPMHMGNARGGAIGDCLAGALEWAGYDVVREFYINDAGNQIEKFGISLEARYLQIFKGEEAVPFPEDGYHGADITAHAEGFAAIHGDGFVDKPAPERKQALVDYALPKNIAALERDLGRYRIEYDVWFRESSLYADGSVDAALKKLAERGMTYEQDGALWVKLTEYGLEKDEVLVRQNGYPTYFAADIAYHMNKFDRGFVRLIDVWGADHHGHVARLKAAMHAVGYDGDKLDIIIMQLVRLTRDGEPVRMSKRSGQSVTLSDLLEEVPIDAARFFFNMREPGSPLDFDLSLANEQTNQNPVYYVQYAHARICSILKNFAAEGILPRAVDRLDLTVLTHPDERQLIMELISLPEEIIAAAKFYDPAHLTHYLMGVATAFHRFYGSCYCRVEDENLMHARLNLCLAAQAVFGNVLGLLKIDAPTQM